MAMTVDPHYVSGLVKSLNNSTLAEQKLTAELSSGLRISTLSDDAVAAGQASMLTASVNRDDSFVQTASTVESRMQVASTTLSMVVSQLTSALSVAVSGTSGTANASNLSAIAQQIGSVRDQVVSLANTSYQGMYLFAGSKGNTQPYTVDTSTSLATAKFSGDFVVNSITTVSGQKIDISLSDPSVFLDVLSALNNLVADFASVTVSATAVADIGVLQKALSNVSHQHEILGTSLKSVQSASTYSQTDAINRIAAASALIAANPATVATQLSAAEVQNQALMSVIATVEKQSLFDFIH